MRRSNLLPGMSAAVMILLLLSGCQSCSYRLDGYLAEAEERSPEEAGLTLLSAAPNVLVCTFTDNFSPESLPMNPLAAGLTDWQVEGGRLKAVHHYSRAVDELPKTSSRKTPYPVNIQYWTYLVLEEPLKNGQNYTVTGPFGSARLRFDDTRTLCESIKVNQAGYHPDSPQRYANLGVFMGSGGSLRFEEPPVYRVTEAATGKTVYEGTAEYRGDDTAAGEGKVTSGEHVYRLDLAPVPAGGPYTVSVAGFGVSYPFEISREAVENIAAVYARGLYHQRCGTALEEPYTEYTRPACHTIVYDTRQEWSSSGRINPPPTAPSFSLAGGYHDAGDFDRRPQHTIIPILLLNYYEAFPDRVSDGQYTIPESGNGLPDLLDEALWGVLAFEHLQVTDPADPDYGGVRAGNEAGGHPEYGAVSAFTDRLVYGTWEVTPEVTAFSAGMMAQAARLLMQFPGQELRAKALWERALIAWDYLSRPEAEGGEPLYSEQKTHNLYASLQLYLASLTLAAPAGRPQERELFHSRFRELAARMLVSGGSWPHQYRPGNSFSALQTVHFISYLLQENLDGSFIDAGLSGQLESIILKEAAKGGYMGYDDDTAFYPQGVTKGYGWGAATAQGRYADVFAFALRLTEDQLLKERYFGIISAFGDYALGLNPLGVSFVTGLGQVQPASPLHLDSYFTKYGKADGSYTRHEGSPIGNVPGILIFGPTEGRSRADYQLAVSDTVYPAWEEMPLQRRWADGWSLVNSSEFSTWETIVWNVCMYVVLSGTPLD